MYYHVTKRNLCAIFVLFALTSTGRMEWRIIVSSSFLSQVDSHRANGSNTKNDVLRRQSKQVSERTKTKSEKNTERVSAHAHRKNPHQHSSSFGTLLLSSWLVLSSPIGDGGVMLIHAITVYPGVLFSLSLFEFPFWTFLSVDTPLSSWLVGSRARHIRFCLGASVSVSICFCFFPNANWSRCYHSDALLHFSFHSFARCSLCKK